MIKYLGSKRRLVPVLGAIASAVDAQTAVDLFTGTTRVAQEFKKRGITTTCVDTASYSYVLAQTFIATDAAQISAAELAEAIAFLNSLPGQPGYFTQTFCLDSRYFQPKNGERVDAIRDAIEHQFANTALYPILLTSLMLAADRVDSTTGIQMAYLKQWSPRSHRDLELRVPELLPGAGSALQSDAALAVESLPTMDLAYLDPPYNQHRYYTNYHIWETLVRWDNPEHYGVACKRVDARDEQSKSRFNRKREMPVALEQLINDVRAETLVLSYNNESWVSAEQLLAWCGQGRETAMLLEFDSRRYVGAQIGIHSPTGDRVGTVSHTRNLEYVVIAGAADTVAAAAQAATALQSADSAAASR